MSELEFDPTRLDGAASLNQVVLADVPGVRSDLVGVRAGEACGRDGIVVVAMAAGLAVDPQRVASQLAASADAGGAGVLTELGTRLGALLATVRHPATPAAQGTTAARRAYLEHWLAVDRVWLAGGLLAGEAADLVLPAVRGVVAGSAAPCPVDVVPDPPLAPLLGAARLLALRHGTGVVADLGHSTIKRAVVGVAGGRLVGIGMLPSLPAPASGSAPDVVADAVEAALIDAGPADDIVASVACYVRNGAPVDDKRSTYSCLGSVNPRPVWPRRFEHDGTASAMATGDPRTAATVTVGTWLGIGFTPSPGGLLDLPPPSELPAR